VWLFYPSLAQGTSSPEYAEAEHMSSRFVNEVVYGMAWVKMDKGLHANSSLPAPDHVTGSGNHRGERSMMNSICSKEGDRSKDAIKRSSTVPAFFLAVLTNTSG
jgi:hypothetical protein